jgi:ABC-2 type transport system ATP-binding protein
VIIDRGRIVADGTPASLLARSRHHNAVTLTLPADFAPAAKEKLQTLSGVLTVEDISQVNGLATITAFPRASTLIIEDVTALASREQWDVRELYAEAGRLDDVFRALTTHDTQRARERRAGGAA